jgi:uncharacterized protein (DUF2141 family)
MEKKLPKKVIVGKPITARQESEFDGYFQNIYDLTSYDVPDCIMKNNAMYWYNADRETIIPKIKLKETVNVPILQFSKSIRSKRTLDKQLAIGFKREGDTRYLALYYIEAKSLVVAYGSYDITRWVFNWLKDNEYISLPINGKYVETMNVIEIHDGVPEIIAAPVHNTPITLGTDPEFEVIRNKNVIQPPSYYRGTNNPIGLDGAGMQIELRPAPSSDPHEVIENMKRLFRELKDPVTVLGNRYPLGGHIHIGVGAAYRPSNDLLFLLDYFLGKPTIELSGRARDHYKRLSAYEHKNWGFEYRTPPAAIFFTPRFCELALKICQNVTSCYISERTMKVSQPYPLKEDYQNYCDFTELDYHDWMKELTDYNIYMVKPTLFNVAHNWDESINVDTTVKSRCAYASWKTGICDDGCCNLCYPDTYQEARRVRDEASRTRRSTPSNTSVNDWTVSLQRDPPVTNTDHDILIGVLREAYGIGVSDAWNITALQVIQRVLMERSYTPEHDILFFGLRRERGNVTYGYDLEGYTRVPENELGAGNRSYGFSRDMRQDNTGMPTRVAALERAVNAVMDVVAENHIDEILEEEGAVEDEPIQILNPPTRPVVLRRRVNPAESVSLAEFEQNIDRLINNLHTTESLEPLQTEDGGVIATEGEE